MVSNTICSSCMRALRQQTRQITTTRSTVTSRIRPLQRSFTTTNPTREETKPTAKTPTPSPPPPKDYNSPNLPPSPDAFKTFASQLRNTNALRSATEPYIAFGGTEDLFQECSRQCSYTIPSALAKPPTAPPMNADGDHLGEGSGWWLEPKTRGGLGLQVTFNSWAQVLYLHMWLLTVRLRCFPDKYVKDWHQNLLDHFFYAAEDRMATWHGMVARGVRNKNLKDLWLQWRGVQLGYDEGLVRGDAVFATAIWRNVFKASPGVDVGDLALVTAYTMRELQSLSKLDDTVVTEGRVRFGDPKTVQQSLNRESSGMRESITTGELKALGKEQVAPK